MMIFAENTEQFISATTAAIFLAIKSVAQLAERRSLAGELTLSCARPSADG